MSLPSASGRPLSGIRVLDLGRYVAAPYCAMLLADLGAEVIRVERPGGDLDRTLGLKAPHGENFTFLALARNKRGVTLELARPDLVREVLHDLIRLCDILIHNYSPAAVEHLELTYEDVRRVRPDVIYAGISAFGLEGPAAGQTGFDPMAQMASGAAALTGPDRSSGPVRTGVPWVDHSTGLATAVGILAALRHRDATGQGQAVEAALLRTAVSFTTPMVSEAVVAKSERPRVHNRLPYVAPANLYPCLDGSVYIVALSCAMWTRLAELLGRPDLAEDPELATAEQRYERRDEIDGAIRRFTSARTAADVARLLGASHIPCAIERSPSEVPGDPQVQATGLLPTVDLEHPGLDAVPVSVAPFRLSAMKADPPTRPPRPGEDNDVVYGALLGYCEDEIHALRVSGAI